MYVCEGPEQQGQLGNGLLVTQESKENSLRGHQRSTEKKERISESSAAECKALLWMRTLVQTPSLTTASPKVP